MAGIGSSPAIRLFRFGCGFGGFGVFFEGEGEAVDFGGGEEGGDLASSEGSSISSALWRLGAGGEFAEHGGEFKLGEEFAGGFEVRFGGLHLGEVEVERDEAVDGDEFFGEEDGLAVLLEGFAVGLALDGVRGVAGGVEDGFYGAVLLDELDGAFVADAGRAGDVVDGVAAEGHDVDDLLGWDAEDFDDFGGVEDEVVFLGVEDADVLGDELHHVLVAGDDEDFVALFGGLAGEGADDVVGLEADGFEDGDVENFEGAADVGELAGEVFGHGFALGFVAEVVGFDEGLVFGRPFAQGADFERLGVAEDGSADVEDRGEVVRGKSARSFWIMFTKT
jgi:hypothetical protein